MATFKPNFALNIAPPDDEYPRNWPANEFRERGSPHFLGRAFSPERVQGGMTAGISPIKQNYSTLPLIFLSGRCQDHTVRTRVPIHRRGRSLPRLRIASRRYRSDLA